MLVPSRRLAVQVPQLILKGGQAKTPPQLHVHDAAEVLAECLPERPVLLDLDSQLCQAPRDTVEQLLELGLLGVQLVQRPSLSPRNTRINANVQAGPR